MKEWIEILILILQSLFGVAPVIAFFSGYIWWSESEKDLWVIAPICVIVNIIFMVVLIKVSELLYMVG